MREIIIDSFAGGGGASLGITRGVGRHPDVAINHDAAAILCADGRKEKGGDGMTPTTLKLVPASADLLPWARSSVITGHPVGCLWFGRPEATCCYTGGLTFGSLADVKAKRAIYDRWEILNLSRVWLSPTVQPSGQFYSPDRLPGYIDRKGKFRSTLASDAIRAALRQIGFDYLSARPPCFVDEPYQIRAVLSYCNTHLHRGVIYRAAGFKLARCNKAGIETWWTDAVSPLSPSGDLGIRSLAAVNPRSVRIRERRAVLA